MGNTSKLLALLGVVLFILLVFFKLPRNKEISIVLIGFEKFNLTTLENKGYLNHFEWVIISSEAQKENWKEEGYFVPKIDFDENNLIISKYKMKRLFKSKKDECSGVPFGIPVFDFELSEEKHYYFYLMPKVMLSQGVG